MSVEGDGDDSPFTRCDECGGIFVHGAAHRCPSGNETHKTRDGRERLAEADDGDPDDEVLYVTGRGDSAYHEAEVTFDLDAMLAPRVSACRVESSMICRTRARAKASGRYPCSYCYPDVHERVE